MDSGQGHLLNVNPQVSTTHQYLLNTVPFSAPHVWEQWTVVNVNPQVSTLSTSYIQYPSGMRAMDSSQGHSAGCGGPTHCLSMFQMACSNDGPLTVCLCFRWPVPMMAHSLFVYVSDDPFLWWPTHCLSILQMARSYYGPLTICLCFR